LLNQQASKEKLQDDHNWW